MNDQNSSGGFLSGLILGLIAGSVIALLTAPQTGQETRRMLGQKSTEFRGKAADTIDEALAQAERAMLGAREATQRTVERAQQQIAELEAKGQKMAEEQRNRLNKLARSVKQGS